MGFPRQEEWVVAGLPRLQVKVAVAEGGSFSFFSSAVPRAPRWMRQLGLEWLCWLAQQPRRLRRQLAIPRFVRAGGQGAAAEKLGQCLLARIQHDAVIAVFGYRGELPERWDDETRYAELELAERAVLGCGA